MNIGENLQNLRKQHNLSQEELADKINVSRQSISKWESGAAIPEMDKIVTLCEVFDCTMDELVRGTNLKTTCANSDLKQAYNHLMRKFSRSISFAIGLILLGTVALLAFSSISAEHANYGLVIFLLFVAISAPIFVIRGIELGDFKLKHPTLENFYTSAEIDEYNLKFSKIIAGAVGIILAGLVIFMALIVANTFGAESPLPAAVFMLFVSVAAPMFVYAGINKGKYDIAHYNYENSTEFKATSEKVGKISGVIMMVATMIFMLLGFGAQLWQIGWIVFPIGGILCGIVATILQKND